jgi:phosphoglycolate phosphatase
VPGVPDVVLFDLDGTISDSQRGILAALRHAFATHGVPPMDAATERTILGPPFYESLPPLIADVPLADVIEAYRTHYSSTMFDTDIYAGVGELIAMLASGGIRLALATSKPEAYAVKIVEHLGLAHHFEVLGGDALDGSRGTKALVIEDVLRRLGDPDPATVMMIGDREHDVHGARAHGVATIGVRWGYGSPGELEGANPYAIAASASEVRAILHGTITT